MDHEQELDARIRAAKADPRTVPELITQILTEPDEDEAWELVVLLHLRGTKDVLDAAANLCVSHCPQERELGANILGQLGVPERSFPAESVKILLTMLATETDVDALDAICIALGHHHDPCSIPALAQLKTHPSDKVRLAVAMALSGFDHELAVNTMIELMQDQDATVRDWATFGLGSQRSDLDTPKIRAALFARLSDDDDITRYEALRGLAERKDERIIEPMIKNLERSHEMEYGWYFIELADEVADARLLPVLKHLRETTSENHTLLDKAIRSCAGETDEASGE